MPRKRHARNPLDLTARHAEIIKLLADDLGTNEIAARLGISPRTVEFHKDRIYRRIGVTGLAGLVRYAIRMGIIEP
jgi:DNA-binding CsgD family transcriptional regulator